MVYSMPAQPPFLTPMRTPAPPAPLLARLMLMRSAARSVKVMTCGLRRGADFGRSGLMLVSRDRCLSMAGNIAHLPQKSRPLGAPRGLLSAAGATADL